MKKEKHNPFKYCHCEQIAEKTYSAASLHKIAGILRNASLPTRLQLLLFLYKEPHCVSDLISHTKKSQTAISHHLATLHKSVLVNKKRDGKFIQYFLTPTGEKFVLSLQVLNN